MGNSIRTFLKKAGCTDKVLNSLFSTSFEQLLTAIQKDDLESVRFFHLIKKVPFSEYVPKVKQGDSALISPGDSPLHVAVSFERLEILKYIVENVKPLNLEDKNFNGDTPFMIASLRGNLEIIQYLAETAHCNVNTRENRGSTPFFAACCLGNMEVIEYFLDRLKVDFKVVNYEGQSVIHRVAFYGLIDTLRYLRKNTNLSFSAVDKKGNSPLHLAAMRLNIACMRYLLRHSSKKEALLGQKNLDGETPVSILVRILNKIKDPSISEITKEEVVKYIEDKKEFPAILKNEITSKIRPTLIGSLSKKEKNENHLKLPINPFQVNSNISPRTMKVNKAREMLMARVTPLNTEKRSLIPLLGSRVNIPPASYRQIPSENPMGTGKEAAHYDPEEHKENLEEVKSALIHRRNRSRGKKNATPSPEKNTEKITINVLDKSLSPQGKAGATSPLNKIKQAIINKFSFLTSPRKRKTPKVNVNKPGVPVSKGLSFKEMSEKVTLEEPPSVNEEGGNLGREENLNRSHIEGGNNEEENPNRSNLLGVFSLFSKNPNLKSPLNKPHFANEWAEGGTPPNNNYGAGGKRKSFEVDIPRDSPFWVIKMENEEDEKMVNLEEETRGKKSQRA